VRRAHLRSVEVGAMPSVFNVYPLFASDALPVFSLSSIGFRQSPLN
jgi:hypothetical protein